MSKYHLFKNDVKYIESYGKHALAVNQRLPRKPYKKPFCALRTLGLSLHAFITAELNH